MCKLIKIRINPPCRSMLESDLENHQAQLTRFQLHVNSVTEDIVSMESMLNSTIMTLKKTLVCATCAFYTFLFSHYFCMSSNTLHIRYMDDVLSVRSLLKSV